MKQRTFLIFLILLSLLCRKSFAQIDISTLDTNNWNVKKANMPQGYHLNIKSLIITPKFNINKDTLFYFFENQNGGKKNVLSLFYSNKTKFFIGCFQGTKQYPDSLFYLKTLIIKDSITDTFLNNIIDTIFVGSNESVFYAINIDKLKIKDQFLRKCFNRYGICKDKSIIDLNKFIPVATELNVKNCPEYFYNEQSFYYGKTQVYEDCEIAKIKRETPCPHKIDKSKIKKYKNLKIKIETVIKDTVETFNLVMRSHKTKQEDFRLFKKNDTIHPFNGIMIEYFSNTRNVYFTKEIRDGKSDFGKTIFYYEDGQKKEEYTTVEKSDIINGRYLSWFENGQKKTDGNYIYNEKDGKWTEWDEKGCIIKVEIYEEGVLKRKVK